MAKNSAQELEWILLIHQLPPKPTNLRVRIWRKLQKLGAVAIKNSVYVLPANEKTHEDFQWLKQEIESAGGRDCPRHRSQRRQVSSAGSGGVKCNHRRVEQGHRRRS